MVESSVFGLSVITLGWIIQLIYSWSGNSELKKRVLTLYTLGIALLVIDSYINGLVYTMTINFISLVVVLVLLIRISPKKVSTPRAIKKKKK